MKWLIALLACGCSYAQIGQTFERGTLKARLDVGNWEADGPTLIASAISADPTVVSYEVTVTFEVSGEPQSRTTIALRPRDKSQWTSAYFVLPYFAKILAFSVLERKDPATFAINSYMTNGTPPFRR